MPKNNPPKKNDIATLRHQINNHLASINLSAEVLLRHYAKNLDKDHKQSIKIILQESKKIQKLLKKFT